MLAALFVALVAASSHSEAPGTARGPHTDLTDFYMFLTARGNVALVVNVAGLSQSQAGPNYNPLSNDFVYQIHIDNNGDGYEDKTFQFLTGYRYANNGLGIVVPVNNMSIPIPLAHVAGPAFGPIRFNATTQTTMNLNSEEYYRVRVLDGDSYTSSIEEGPFMSTTDGNNNKVFEFTKAFDNAGTKSFGEAPSDIANGFSKRYEEYVESAATYRDVQVPGCSQSAMMFVGPRRESFGIALGEVFDAINIDPGPVTQSGTRSTLENVGSAFYDGNSLDRMSVISFVIEIAPECLQNAQSGKVLGAWASVASLDHRNDNKGVGRHFVGQQTNRLGNPLVNELLIGTTFKNEWSVRHPSGDARFNDFLLNPVVPVYIQTLFEAAAGVMAPAFSRVDIPAVLHTGIPGLNLPINQATGNHNGRKGGTRKNVRGNKTKTPAPPGVVYADMLRINLEVATWVPCNQQNNLGVIGGDTAGYPNGRRLGDDVVDITLRVAMGALCSAQTAATYCGSAANVAPSGSLGYTDQAPNQACMFRCDTDSGDDFPFLNTPIPGNFLFQPNSRYTVSQFQKGCPQK